MPYRIERYNGEPARFAGSWTEAIQIAESWVGSKLHQGASGYTVDWGGENAERYYGVATDFWINRENAMQEMSTTADVVIVTCS